MNAGLIHGGRDGLRMVVCLQLALLLQLSVTALGVGALLATSERAFQVLLWGGAAYLVWLGVVQLRAAWGGKMPSGQHLEDWSLKTLLWRGMLVNLSNPKAILFQAVLVPHFINMSRPLFWQYLIIAMTMCGVGSLVMGAYAHLAARLRLWFDSPRLARWRSLLFGLLFVGFGLALLINK
jgi:homoserine/homoserine lactone efflux protein